MQMSPRQFEALVQQAYRDLPDAVRRVLDNLDIVVEDAPGSEAQEALDPHDHEHGDTLLGLYVGVPLVERYAADPLLPDCIYLYRLPILSMCDSEGEVAEEIRTTLLHEIGHFLGLSEADLDRLGYA
jgi:predicted Zn-dependent protease with MMP-like domain